MSNNNKELKKYYSQALDLEEVYNRIGSRVKDVKEIFSHTKIKDPRTLEIGCAYGRDAKEILKYTNNYLGIDFSKELIELARKNLPDINFKVADIHTYIFPQNLDVIISFASLVHMNKTEMKPIIRKAYNSLNKNGLFYISVYCGKYRKRIKKDELGSRIFYYYTEEDFRKMTEKFSIHKVFYEDRARGRWINILLKKTV